MSPLSGGLMRCGVRAQSADYLVDAYGAHDVTRLRSPRRPAHRSSCQYLWIEALIVTRCLGHRPSLPHVGRGWVWRIGKRSVNWNATTVKIAGERVSDLRHTYVRSRDGPVPIFAHTYADLFMTGSTTSRPLHSLDDVSEDT